MPNKAQNDGFIFVRNRSDNYSTHYTSQPATDKINHELEEIGKKTGKTFRKV